MIFPSSQSNRNSHQSTMTDLHIREDESLISDGPPLIAIGGCHLTGFPGGRDTGYLTKALHRAGIFPRSQNISPPTYTRNSTKFLKKIEVEPGSIFFLQLGNSETGRSLISGQGPRARGALLRADREIIATTKANSFRSLLTSPVKIATLLARDSLHTPVYSSLEMESELRKLLQEISLHRPRAVVLLSTFYSLQPHINIYRRRANRIMKKIAEEAGVIYIDVFNYIRNEHRARRKLFTSAVFSDPEHLSLLGHSLLGSFVGSELSRRIQPPGESFLNNKHYHERQK